MGKKEMRLPEKLGNLAESLRNYGRVAVAFSGGVDSTFLLLFAEEILGGENVIAVTAEASNFAPDELLYAKRKAEHLGIRHLIVPVTLPERFRANPKDRCYHCKKAVFAELMKCLEEAGAEDAAGFVLCDGSNADDRKDYRPGRRAAEELGVKSPLEEAELTKDEIREALHERGEEIWNKPAFACLASRIPYGTEITDDKMQTVYELEKMLRDRGYTQVRARLHDEVVRLELLPDEMQKLAADRDLCETLSARAASRGFAYTALDLCGYRMGSLNALSAESASQSQNK